MWKNVPPWEQEGGSGSWCRWACLPALLGPCPLRYFPVHLRYRCGSWEAISTPLSPQTIMLSHTWSGSHTSASWELFWKHLLDGPMRIKTLTQIPQLTRGLAVVWTHAAEPAISAPTGLALLQTSPRPFALTEICWIQWLQRAYQTLKLPGNPMKRRVSHGG